MQKSDVSLTLWTGGALSAIAALGLVMLGTGAAAAATVAGLAAAWAALVWRYVGRKQAYSEVAGRSQSQIEQHLDELAAETRSARAELEQLKELLSDAILRLVTSFSALYGLAERGQATAPEGGINADFAQQVNKAVTALQFQDMANQLVGHIDTRVAAIEQLTGSSAKAPTLAPVLRAQHMPQHEQRHAALDELGAAVIAAHGRRRDSPVAQARAAQGSAELF